MSQQSSQISALEWKPRPQKPPKQEFPGLAHTSSKDPHSGNEPHNKPGLPEHAKAATTTHSTGITGPPAESTPPGEIPQWISAFRGRGGGGWDQPLSHCPSLGWPQLHVGPRSEAQFCSQVSGDLSQTLYLTTTPEEVN